MGKQRLLIKVGCGGVDISSLHPKMRVALKVVGILWGLSKDVIITCTWDGSHMVGSFHPFKRALDIAYPSNWSDVMAIDLKAKLEGDFDVIYHDSHIHIEYQPK